MKRWIKASSQYNTQLEYVGNVNGYQVYRKIVDGRGKWFAHHQDDPMKTMFPITYDQARGFEDMPARSSTEQLSRDLGRDLLPVRSSSSLNEDEREYLVAKICSRMEKLFPEYDVDDINRQGNRIGFGLYDDHGNEYGHYVFTYRPDYEDGPEEQLDDWIEDKFE